MVPVQEGDITSLVRQVANHVSVKADKPVKRGIERELTPIQKVVRAYKRLIKHPEDDTAWDKVYWARNSRSAKSLLILFDNDLDRIARCMVEVSDLMKEKKLDWTFETIVKRAGDWKRDNPVEVKDDISNK